MGRQFSPVQGAPVVVVSGASSGIGEESALFLNELGYTVAAGVRRPEDGERIRSSASRPDRLHPILFDVTGDEQVDGARQAAEDLLSGGSRFAGVFSNAGIATMAGDTSSEGTSMESLERTMAVNFFGAVRFIRAFLPMARASNGRVLVNSALMAKTVLPFNAGYAASKRALEGWCDSLRREVEPHGVRVVLIEAAAISTSLTASHGTVCPIIPIPSNSRSTSGLTHGQPPIETTRSAPPGVSPSSSPTDCKYLARKRATRSAAARGPSQSSATFRPDCKTDSCGDWSPHLVNSVFGATIPCGCP